MPAARRPSRLKPLATQVGEAAASPLEQRSAGVLLHLTSLPGPHGNGDLGPAARRFIDFLALAGQRWWQMLPVNPAGQGNSPYSGVSAFSGNPLLINLHDLVPEGLLEQEHVAFELASARSATERSATERARPLRAAALRRAFAAHQRRPRRHARALERFRAESSYWLPDYALYMALRGAMGNRRWPAWPRELAQRERRALARARKQLASEIAYFEFEQFLFNLQWERLREYGRARGVGLIGDAPIFIAHESADVWASPSLFMLDAQGEPTHVAGVPPDYFCETGQRWGNPLYLWEVSKRTGYRWWIERFRRLLAQFDVVRLDHFIGFSRYWQVPAEARTAERGSWQPGPGRALFDAARERLGSIPFIAEDLGEVTAEVRRLRDELGLPGMRVLQFAFGADVQAHEFLPHRYVRRSVAYTGTHDNDTFVGWFQDKGGKNRPRSARQVTQERRAAIAYMAGPRARALSDEVHWEAIRCIYGSVADTVIVPLQDVLGLDNGSRMNTPGSAEGNWEWRLPARALGPKLARRLRQYATTYDRLSPPAHGQKR